MLTELFWLIAQADPELGQTVQRLVPVDPARALKASDTLGASVQRSALLMGLQYRTDQLSALRTAAEDPNATPEQRRAYNDALAAVNSIVGRLSGSTADRSQVQIETPIGTLTQRDVYGNPVGQIPIYSSTGSRQQFPTNVTIDAGTTFTAAQLEPVMREILSPDGLSVIQRYITNGYQGAIARFMPPRPTPATEPLPFGLQPTQSLREVYDVLKQISEGERNPNLFDKMYRFFTGAINVVNTAQQKAIPWLLWALGSLGATGQLDVKLIHYDPNVPLSEADKKLIGEVQLRTLTAKSETVDLLYARSTNDAIPLDALVMLSYEQNEAQVRASVGWAELVNSAAGRDISTPSPPYAVVLPPGTLSPSPTAIGATNLHYQPPPILGLPSVISAKWDIGLRIGDTAALSHTTGGVLVNLTPGVRTNPVYLAGNQQGVSLGNLALVQPPGSMILLQGTYAGDYGVFTTRDLGPVWSFFQGTTQPVPSVQVNPPNARTLQAPAVILNPAGQTSRNLTQQIQNQLNVQPNNPSSNTTPPQR